MSFQTEDFPLAVTLSLYSPIEKIERSKDDKNRLVFSFPEYVQINGKIEKTSDVADAYWRDEVLVSPLQFHAKLKHLRSVIYEYIKK